MRTYLGFLVVCCFWAGPLAKVHCQVYQWTTLAGTPQTFGYTDGTNQTARFYWPDGITIDAAGNMFICDHSAVRKLTAEGTNWVLRTIAGVPGTSGYADGGGDTARFDYVQGVALDNTGSFYVTELFADTVRKITPVGT